MKETWINHFITELEGHKRRTIRIGREEGEVEEEEQEITDEEIEKQLKKAEERESGGHRQDPGRSMDL